MREEGNKDGRTETQEEGTAMEKDEQEGEGGEERQRRKKSK